MSRFRRPTSFDYNVIVIGAGSGGLVASYIAATLKAKVALVEKHKMGGDCLNTGCVPSKALIRSARLFADLRRAADFGLGDVSVEFDFADVMERVEAIIRKIEPHDSVARYASLGVDCHTGNAFIRDPYRVQVGDRVLTSRHLIVATGARPFVPSIEGLSMVDYLTSDTVWKIRKLPERLVVLGGGPIGAELAQAFAIFGVAVTVVEMARQLLPREDTDVAGVLADAFRESGVDVRTNHKVKAVEKAANGPMLVCDHDGADVAIPFDTLLVAVGRQPNVTGFGLEELGVRLDRRGAAAADPFLRTNVPNIYVCGDVTGPFQYTHSAAQQAWHASMNALLAPFWSFRIDQSVLPSATFVDPEIARVGLNEKEAKEGGIPYEVTRYDIGDLDRAIADDEAKGFVKVLTRPKSDKILGVTVVSSHAAEIIAEFVLAMKQGLGLSRILQTVHIYPTWAEANRYAAGLWSKAHTPPWVFGFLKVFHKWRRGCAS